MGEFLDRLKESEIQDKRTAYLTDEKVVRHGLGILDGNNMSNSLETLEDSFQKGYRFMEVDLSVTSDGCVVCSHGFLKNDYIRYGMEYKKGENVPTRETFLSWKIYGKYTPMALENLIEWMTKHENVCFFFDVKEADYRECTEIAAQIQAAVGNNVKLYDRIVFSARNTEMVQAYKQTGVFKWLHLWMAPDAKREKEIYTPEAFIEFCRDNGVSSWSVEKLQLTEELAVRMAGSGMKSYVYMIETDAEMARYAKLGADFFTSDSLSAQRFEEIRNYAFFINNSKVDGDHFIRLNWSHDGTDCEYEVYRFLENEKALKVGETQECTFEDTDIEAGVLYHYFIKVKGSEERTPDYERATLSKPQAISVKVENGISTISWDACPFADGYTIRRSTDGKSTESVKIIFDGNETIFSEEAIDGAAYKIQSYIVVRNKRYYSGYSQLVSVEYQA